MPSSKPVVGFLLEKETVRTANLEIVEDFAWKCSEISHFSIFHFPLFLFTSFFMFFIFFSFLVVRTDDKTGKHRREVPFVKITILFCENSIFEPRWTKKGGERGGRKVGVAHLR